MGKEIIAEQLLEILACPSCKGDVTLVEYEQAEHVSLTRDFLVNREAFLRHL